jgi:hypothetical protein
MGCADSGNRCQVSSVKYQVSVIKSAVILLFERSENYENLKFNFVPF